ncbi:hypothetical protein JX265_011629 [Neoarthrinium moseri]|uniref:ABM domain-containing protein n=1 Tax=Neoarthrinium moseri TaxID=1658444 RepID=A0A9P9WC73_9PEZI|nr:uncharacterized protein JN550_011920 [Neoarthrinium moseri]KAI1845520.1 hypothetical protein JX266_008378 [Neoarthrinium moseri]KAI1856382.1 hypothetical protein JX265_011629 [Neoarthrinium moseri]KAI1859612.1 hypothetical protein JN550_011920 [Neoarthrinium moseri]
MPDFFVIARVVGSDGAYPKWKDRLVALCTVSKTEPHSTTYYWGQDVDNEPDTIWGLEGYTHAVGFFLGHPASDVFKSEMQKVDNDRLLRHVQGLGSPDYDLKYYDYHAGFLKRPDDPDRDATDSFVVIIHLSSGLGRRKQVLGLLADSADAVRSEKSMSVQSFAVLKEVMQENLCSVYIRSWESLQATPTYQHLIAELERNEVTVEVHRSQAFNGHIDQEPPRERP